MKTRCEAAAEETELVRGGGLHQPGEPGLGRDREAEEVTLGRVGPQDFPLQGGQSSRSSRGEEVD